MREVFTAVLGDRNAIVPTAYMLQRCMPECCKPHTHCLMPSAQNPVHTATSNKLSNYTIHLLF